MKFLCHVETGGDGHICHIKEIYTVHINMFDGTVKELQDVVCSSVKEERYLSWS